MAMLPIQVTVELLIGGSWVDISSFVYQRNPLTITGGRSASADKPSPATLTVTVNNRDGRFSPLYTGGAYYPNLKRNVQIRVSATAQSSSGNYFSGYRFWGEVTSWPPLSDISGNDVWVDVTAHGPLRRTRDGGGQGSALSRYYQMLTGSYAPVAYWPCEEDPRAGGFTAADPQGSQIGTGLPNGLPMNITSGTPAWKANNSFNGSAPIPVLNKSTWDGLTGSFNSSGDDIYNVAGTYQWVASTTTVNVKVWGGGGGGENGGGGAGGGRGGGGGEFAQNTALAVTPGTAYPVVVGAGGSGGNYNSHPGTDNPGQNGRQSKMTGDVASVTAHGGLGGLATGGGAGGTGSAAPVHFDGGLGGGGTLSTGNAGSGGGSSAGTAAAGNLGGTATFNVGGAGGAAVTGGGAGGRGGDVPVNNNAAGGHSPGGGGGGGSLGTYAAAGQSGADGKVELVYTPQTSATVNVIRFVIQVPPHGGNPGNVLLRVKTSSAVLDHLDVTYETGQKFRLQGFNSSNVQQFDSTALSWAVDGNPLMVSVELKQNGTGVDWAFKTITPGATALRNSASGTKASASVGNVTEVIAAPNGDITQTALGHISVQYTLIDLRKVSRHLHGHHAEIGIDRFIRLCNEQAMANVPEFNEKADHWGFEEGLQGWTAVNAAASRSTVTASGIAPWDFPASGTPTNNSYFITTNARAALVSEGDTFVSLKNPGLLFTVYNVGPPAFGFNNIQIRPMAPVLIDSTDTVTQVVNAGINDPVTVVFPVYGGHSLLLTTGFLTGDASTFEAGVANWTGGGNAAVARSNVQAHAGTWSLGLTCVTGPANMQAASCAAGSITTQGMTCAPGQTITASAWFRTAVTARSCNIGVDFYDSSGVVIGGSLRGADITDSSAAWTQATASVTAPASSAFCRANLQVKTAATSELHFADDVLLNGYPSAIAPVGTLGQPVSVGDIVSVAAHVYSPTALTGAFAGIRWYTAAGAACAHAGDDGDDTAVDAGDAVTVKSKFTAPATAAFFAPVAGNHQAQATGTLIYIDNVRVSPRMGPQTRKHLHKFMEEIEDLDQGIMREYKHAWGHGYRTRFRLINQTPVVTLDYAQGMLSPPLAPEIDPMYTKNDITVRREKGSKRRISDETGPAGAAEPPAGAGRRKRLHRVVAEEDAQLAALAQHLLNLGTVTGERFPVVSLNLARCSLAGNAMAPLLSAIASAEIGDMIQINNLAFWYPSATAKQLIIGYTETLGPFQWDLAWNCVNESPWEIVATSQRRW